MVIISGGVGVLGHNGQMGPMMVEALRQCPTWLNPYTILASNFTIKWSHIHWRSIPVSSPKSQIFKSTEGTSGYKWTGLPVRSRNQSDLETRTFQWGSCHSLGGSHALGQHSCGAQRVARVTQLPPLSCHCLPSGTLPWVWRVVHKNRSNVQKAVGGFRTFWNPRCYCTRLWKFKWMNRMFQVVLLCPQAFLTVHSPSSPV